MFLILGQQVFAVRWMGFIIFAAGPSDATHHETNHNIKALHPNLGLVARLDLGPRSCAALIDKSSCCEVGGCGYEID